MHKFTFVPNLQQSRRLRLRGGLLKTMASSLENHELDVENKLGVIRPATDAYEAEALEALKAGEIIAVPTVPFMDLLVMLGMLYK